MASVQTDNTSLTILNGAGLFAPANADPNWSPVVVAKDVTGMPAEDSRIYVKPNTEEGYDNAAATKGTRSAKFAVGGSSLDSDNAHGLDANTIIFQMLAPGGLEAPLNGKLPVVRAHLSAEADASTAELTAIEGMAPVVGLISQVLDPETGLHTIAVRLKVPRVDKGIVVVEVNFGYSASN
jgi:hypothetical protein